MLILYLGKLNFSPFLEGSPTKIENLMMPCIKLLASILYKFKLPLGGLGTDDVITLCFHVMIHELCQSYRYFIRSPSLQTLSVIQPNTKNIGLIPTG